MNTLPHFTNIANGFNRIASSMLGLESEFTNVAPITDLDKAQIDVMIGNAQAMIATAEALKLTEYNPIPPQEG